jgi:cobalt-zinc-cadmium efflux system outer membrane protein
VTDLPDPLVSFPDRSRTLSFGVSIELPIFKKNQGAKAEAAVAITQAERRRALAEQLVRGEIVTAYTRYRAAQTALATFEQGVMARSSANIEVIREAYRLGAFRVTELLAEQRRLLDTQREFSELLVERYRALADLQTAIGRPLQ